MFAHADETDDFEPATKAHPGSAIVPAALAMAEREGRSGAEMLAAVTLGYDVCCRFLHALGADRVRASHRSAEGTSSTMGAVAAAASLARLDEKGLRHALSYAAQQVSGIWSWVRDAEHVEKAFDFSGMGARNGVTAAIMVQLGFSGVWDVLDGEHNALLALSADPKPEEMVAGLGNRFFVTETAIKPYSVGLFAADTFERIGLFDENCFVYFEDTDYFLRMKRSGLHLLYAPGISIAHKISLSTGGPQSDFSIRYYQRNQMYVLRKNFGLVTVATQVVLLTIKATLRWLARRDSFRQYGLRLSSMGEGLKMPLRMDAQHAA